MAIASVTELQCKDRVQYLLQELHVFLSLPTSLHAIITMGKNK